ncbi:RNA-dependent RNA polymerase 6-like [Gossypium australe]|uniref:RNA-dependent RNA polymerase 6-like n=1 Tax=Gossypium australe TaxID=47621 RepID=A0A5B6VYQ4_9ROSI|nr:RNA-dependent RNA polymerase 6-like [Gossypium australe]
MDSVLHQLVKLRILDYYVEFKDKELIGFQPELVNFLKYMELEGSVKETVVTQVSVGGFDRHVKARDLMKYLENEVGLVWRCRLKTSWTPQESYPNFEITYTTVIQRKDNYKKVEPHAFVHFASPQAVTWAVDAAALLLKVSLGPENPYYLNRWRRDTTPFKLPDVSLEIGTLASRDEFFLASSPWVWYRTADDDFEKSVPFDLLDDDDQWIRTTDFTASGAIGRCNTYRVVVRPRHGLKLKKAMDYLRERRVPVEDLRSQLRIRDEPDFGRSMSDHFYYSYKEGIHFEIMFLVNAVLYKGIFNQHQLSEDFFKLLRNQSMEVNVAALKHIYSYRRPVYDAYKRLKVVHDWLLRNPKLFKSPPRLDDIVEIRRLVITPTKAYCLLPCL